jgi:hypothetical protein
VTNVPDQIQRRAARRAYLLHLDAEHQSLALIQLLLLSAAIGAYVALPQPALGVSILGLVVGLIPTALTLRRVLTVKARVERGAQREQSQTREPRGGNDVAPPSPPTRRRSTLLREFMSIRSLYALMVGLQVMLLTASLQIYTRWPDKAHRVLVLVVAWLLTVCTLTCLRLSVQANALERARRPRGLIPG